MLNICCYIAEVMAQTVLFSETNLFFSTEFLGSVIYSWDSSSLLMLSKPLGVLTPLYFYWACAGEKKKKIYVESFKMKCRRIL